MGHVFSSRKHPEHQQSNSQILLYHHQLAALQLFCFGLIKALFIGFPKRLLSVAKVLDGQKNGEGAADKVSGADVGSRLRAPQAANHDLLDSLLTACCCRLVFCLHTGSHTTTPRKEGGGNTTLHHRLR